MSSEPSLVDELWESLVAVVIAAAAGLWWLLRRPWLLGTALIATGVVVAGGWLAVAVVLGVVLLAWPACGCCGRTCLPAWCLGHGGGRRPGHGIAGSGVG